MPKQRTREKTNPATKTIIIGLVSFFFFPFLAIVTAGMAHSIADVGLSGGLNLLAIILMSYAFFGGLGLTIWGIIKYERIRKATKTL